MTAPRAGCAAIVDAMKTGGYFQRIMAAGPELDRVKDYLHALEGTAAAASPGPLQYPDYPLFPGLRNQPFRDTGDLEGPLLLERNAGMIHDEWAALDDSAYIRYAPAAMRSLWMVHLLHYMGVGMPARPGECDGTRALLRRLPGVSAWRTHGATPCCPSTRPTRTCVPTAASTTCACAAISRCRCRPGAASGWEKKHASGRRAAPCCSKTP